jgi:dipeptidyl aminopeptidase/acylaminoacyl peptidase
MLEVIPSIQPKEPEMNREVCAVRRSIWHRALFVIVVVMLAAAPVWAQEGYRKPPKAIQDVLDAPATPSVGLNPTRDYALVIQAVRYPSIADLAQPMLRLAGLRINPATNGPHRAMRNIALTLKSVADGKETKIILPPDPYLGMPTWSPDGKRFAVSNTTPTVIELWIGEVSTGALRKIAGVALNSVLGAPCDWMPDSRTLLCKVVPAGRGKPPERPLVPKGPNIQESYGKPAPVRTYEDLLTNEHDAKLFDYYATAQLVLLGTASGKSTPVGKPALFSSVDVAPDGQYLLVTMVHRPYSYLVPVSDFPRDVEVWDRAGKSVYKLASLPLAEDVPIGGVLPGPRGVQWKPTERATLVWVEALDGGNPRTKVPHRDRVLWLKAPFTGQPSELTRTQHRFAGISWGERGDFAILRDFDRDRLWSRTWFFDPNQPAETLRLVWDLSSQDRYNNPGMPVSTRLPSGRSAVLQSGDFIFLTGAGASREGDRPFLDRFNIKTLKGERLFQCAEKTYESVVTLLAKDGSKFLTRYESPTEPPNYVIRAADGSKQAFTNFPDPAPQLRGIQKQLVTYKRADGVDLSFTLYLPPDYKPGERRPAVVWAYPREYTDPSVAGQVSGSPYRFVSISGISHLFFLLAGYVVLDDAALPVVGDPETVNNTYIEQIVAGAKAAIDKGAEMGVIDPDRVGVGGHSYGAFMTANLLAHCDLFRAGIARSGAYNRTLTPFGFQSERRTIWEAREIYMKMSPFLYANQINEPILLIHGEADDNSGTFPIQSERMYHAIKGNGGSVRYVTLPHEAHGYAARESVEHTLWEMVNWFDRHVKNAGPRAQAAQEQKK